MYLQRPSFTLQNLQYLKAGDMGIMWEQCFLTFDIKFATLTCAPQRLYRPSPSATAAKPPSTESTSPPNLASATPDSLHTKHPPKLSLPYPALPRTLHLHSTIPSQSPCPTKEEHTKMCESTVYPRPAVENAVLSCPSHHRPSILEPKHCRAEDAPRLDDPLAKQERMSTELGWHGIG
jgi:hypothetical protein